MSNDPEKNADALKAMASRELITKSMQLVSRDLKDLRQAEEQDALDEIERLRRELAHLEDPQTIFSFGQMSFDGDGAEQNYVEAAAWFHIAAEQGHAGAQHNLALMYEDGQGVLQDYSEAAKWYRMAAEQGNPASQNNLGSLYEIGSGVSKDYADL